MKNVLKILSLVLTLAILLSIGIAGCSSSGTTSGTGTTVALGTASTVASATAQASVDKNLVIWSQASDHIGEKVTLFGPIIDSKAIEGYVVLGMGVSVNASGGVSIKIADTDQDNFPGDLYVGEAIKATGTVNNDADGLSMIITDPSQIIVTD
jgi:hypothetical protein